jgi:hypothetical protein
LSARDYADDVNDLHGSAEQLEAHMESEGFSAAEIDEQMQRLGYNRVYERVTCGPA